MTTQNVSEPVVLGVLPMSEAVGKPSALPLGAFTVVAPAESGLRKDAVSFQSGKYQGHPLKNGKLSGITNLR